MWGVCGEGYVRKRLSKMVGLVSRRSRFQMALQRNDVGAGGEQRLFDTVESLAGEDDLFLKQLLILRIEGFGGDDLGMNGLAQAVDRFEIADRDVRIAGSLRGGLQGFLFGLRVNLRGLHFGFG